MPMTNIEERIEKKVEEFKSAFECKSERCSFETPHLHQPNGEIEPILDFLRSVLLSIARDSRTSALKEAEEVHPTAESARLEVCGEGCHGDEGFNSAIDEWTKNIRSLRTKGKE